MCEIAGAPRSPRVMPTLASISVSLIAGRLGFSLTSRPAELDPDLSTRSVSKLHVRDLSNAGVEFSLCFVLVNRTEEVEEVPMRSYNRRFCLRSVSFLPE